MRLSGFELDEFCLARRRGRPEGHRVEARWTVDNHVWVARRDCLARVRWVAPRAYRDLSRRDTDLRRSSGSGGGARNRCSGVCGFRASLWRTLFTENPQARWLSGTAQGDCLKAVTRQMCWMVVSNHKLRPCGSPSGRSARPRRHCVGQIQSGSRPKTTSVTGRPATATTIRLAGAPMRALSGAVQRPAASDSLPRPRGSTVTQ